jgi:hypothetical protein
VYNVLYGCENDKDVQYQSFDHTQFGDMAISYREYLNPINQEKNETTNEPDKVA